ncbi:hypothetical protein J6590_074253 [Homalodisca vitripennis]|nr:hypothetical protein J6590_074253 [Homalodisca vitripennis]
MEVVLDSGMEEEVKDSTGEGSWLGAETCRSRCPPVFISRSLVLSGGGCVALFGTSSSAATTLLEGEGSEDGFDDTGHDAPQPWCEGAAAGPDAAELGKSQSSSSSQRVDQLIITNSDLGLPKNNVVTNSMIETSGNGPSCVAIRPAK